MNCKKIPWLTSLEDKGLMQYTPPKNPTMLAASSASGFENRHLPKLWDCGKILPQALRYIRLRETANYDQKGVPHYGRFNAYS